MSVLTEMIEALSEESLSSMQQHLSNMLPHDGREQLPEVLTEVREVARAALPNEYRITGDDWSQAEQQATGLLNSWRQLQGMNGQDGNLSPAYQHLTNFSSYARELLGRLRPHVYADPDTMGRALVDARALISEAQSLDNQVRSTESAANEALKIAQDAAAQIAENTLLKDFDQKATDHRASARLWLTGTAVASVLLAVAGLVLLTKIEPGSTSTAATIREVSLKVAILAVLAFAVAFSAKNYRANRHMQISYEMRGSIVKTAMALRGSVEDGRTKDAIIEAMVVSVFSVADSGFSSDGATPTDPTITGALLSLSRQGGSGS